MRNGPAGEVALRRAPRQLRVFRTPTQITITKDLRNARSVIELVAGDIATARVLDLFAGTGALGLEAASRGATSPM